MASMHEITLIAKFDFISYRESSSLCWSIQFTYLIEYVYAWILGSFSASLLNHFRITHLYKIVKMKRDYQLFELSFLPTLNIQYELFHSRLYALPKVKKILVPRDAKRRKTMSQMKGIYQTTVRIYCIVYSTYRINSKEKLWKTRKRVHP